MSAVAFGSVLLGLTAYPVRVSASLLPGQGGLLEVKGLEGTHDDHAVRELVVRVRAALCHLSCVSLTLDPCVVVQVDGVPRRSSLASLDLAVAAAVLRAKGRILPGTDDQTIFVGELSLSGEVRAVRGALTHARSTTDRFVCSSRSSFEVGLVRTSGAYAVAHVRDLLEPLPSIEACEPATCPSEPPAREVVEALSRLARAGSRVLLVGAPSARHPFVAALRSATPPLSRSEAVESAEVLSAAGLFRSLTTARSFRAPHHTISEDALLSGGEYARPGEVALAHRGVLLLDELVEFRRSSITALACVLRQGRTRNMCGGAEVNYPAVPYIVAATASPCPCWSAQCRCRVDTKAAYAGRLVSYAATLGLTKIDCDLAFA